MAAINPIDASNTCEKDLVDITSINIDITKNQKNTNNGNMIRYSTRSSIHPHIVAKKPGSDSLYCLRFKPNIFFFERKR